LQSNLFLSSYWCEIINERLLINFYYYLALSKCHHFFCLKKKVALEKGSQFKLLESYFFSEIISLINAGSLYLDDFYSYHSFRHLINPSFITYPHLELSILGCQDNRQLQYDNLVIYLNLLQLNFKNFNPAVLSYSQPIFF